MAGTELVFMYLAKVIHIPNRNVPESRSREPGWWDPGRLPGRSPGRKRGPRPPPGEEAAPHRRPHGPRTRPSAPTRLRQRSCPRCPPTAPAAPPGEETPGAHAASSGRRPPSSPGPRARIPGARTPSRWWDRGRGKRHSRGRSPAQLSPRSRRPSCRPRPGGAAAGPAERPRRDAAARLASPHGVAGALRSPAQHKPGLSPSLREVSCHHSGRGKQKLQSREREEEERQRKQRSEGHCSPAASLPSATDSRGGQPAQRRLPICFGGGSAARAVPRNRRTAEQAGEPAPPPLPSVRPCPPAGSTPRPARRRRRAPPVPRLRLPGARAGSGRAAPAAPGGRGRFPAERPRHPRAPRAALGRSAAAPCHFSSPSAEQAVPVKLKASP
ncbi:serine/arginine repetitive matrix protein 1-like [Agelaius tricolor]|uniref:serine/arginine repetitive matrix protein 1-like n=1 Tax=Agelaius tricolor TaxID=9191 RepID=UPI0039F1AE29